MDTLRGNFANGVDDFGEPDYYDPADDEAGREMPPSPIGQDERRMQVRAYNYWANLLEDRHFPSVEDIDPQNLPDFGPYSVLLDFSVGIENPNIVFLGAKLAKECGAEGDIASLSDVPSRSLLSRITDHYMQILANQAPIGFEAEFVNQDGRTILYRGILLPFSSDDDTIDFIYGVINWKELADQFTTDELMLEIDQALNPENAIAGRTQQGIEPLTSWADSPLASKPARHLPEDAILDLSPEMEADESEIEATLPKPGFGWNLSTAAAADPSLEGELPSLCSDESEMELGDWLASAREMARAAHGNEERTRQALYAAIGRAYDFSIAAAHAPEEFDELLADYGLTRQARAPMTPVVKLVFGADYDKTRLTEYAAALNHGHRLGLAQGELTAFLSAFDGGLKGVVKAERLLRREESGKPARDAAPAREKLARKLRGMEPRSFDMLPPQGHEFGLVMIRRLPEGHIAMLGELPQDDAMLARAARQLIG
ncbi:MAG: PAS domain-containing protein [Novosphingobium sp.]